jgi:hypothetical protein
MRLILKLSTTIFLFLIINQIALGQATSPAFEPKILILSPSQTVVSPLLEKEVRAQNDSLTKMANLYKTNLEAIKAQSEGKAPNIMLMFKNSIPYVTSINFFKNISFLADNYLVYRFYERFPNVLILLKDTSMSVQLTDMQLLAKQQQIPYIISFPKVELVMENGQRSAKIRMLLYEQTSNSFLIDKDYTGDERNPGFEFTCEDGTINCTINNALSQALPDVLKQIAGNNPTLKKERALSLERKKEVQNNLLHRDSDHAFISKIISPADSSIDLKLLYQCFHNEDKTQFVAFFLKTGVTNSLKSLYDKKDKGKVNIITGKDIHDKDYLDSIPKTYAYIVKGVLYNGKWYYKKDEATYFDAAAPDEGQLQFLGNLEGWGYFKENSTDYSPTFWSDKLFEKIHDRRKDPDWEKNKHIYEMDERENREYIGLYEIVAEQLKEEKEVESSAYREQISKTILIPFFKTQAQARLNDIAKYDPLPGNYYLIFPKDKHILLSPVKITDGKGNNYMRFFAIIPATGHIYEWIYFKPFFLKQGYADSQVNEMMGSITNWNYSYKTLDDENFWNNYVLVKSGDQYKYLKELK